MAWMGADLVLQARDPSYWPASAGLTEVISSTAPADSPHRSYQRCTQSPGRSRTAACLWCRGPFCHRTRACWRGGACSCRSRPSPSGPAGRSPQPGAGLGSRTWKRRFSTQRSPWWQMLIDKTSLLPPQKSAWVLTLFQSGLKFSLWLKILYM